MEKEIMQGATSSQRRRGRPRTRWQDNITKCTGLTDDRFVRLTCVFNKLMMMMMMFVDIL